VLAAAGTRRNAAIDRGARKTQAISPFGRPLSGAATPTPNVRQASQCGTAQREMLRVMVKRLDRKHIAQSPLEASLGIPPQPDDSAEMRTDAET
jgi:hypothetical protein